MALVILGPPRTKKNHGRIVRAGKRLRLLPSLAQVDWAKSAIRQLRQQWRAPTFTTPVSVKARFFRDRAVGDLVNYFQALADALEHAGVVVNDRLIVSWDGSRLDKDSMRPPVELEVELFREAQPFPPAPPEPERSP